MIINQGPKIILWFFEAQQWIARTPSPVLLFSRSIFLNIKVSLLAVVFSLMPCNSTGYYKQMKVKVFLQFIQLEVLVLHHSIDNSWKSRCYHVYRKV